MKNLKTLSTLWGHKKHVDKILIFYFSYEKTKLTILPGKKSNWVLIIFIHKSYKEIVDKIIKDRPKNRAKINFYVFGGSLISLLLHIDFSFFQAS